MHRHGHHAFGEIDVHSPRWSETPEVVLALLRGYLNGFAGADPDEFQRRAGPPAQRIGAATSASNSEIPSAASTSTSSSARQGLALPFAKTCEMKSYACWRAVRRALLELGDRLVRRGVLTERDDIFFVELPELQPLCDRRKPGQQRSSPGRPSSPTIGSIAPPAGSRGAVRSPVGLPPKSPAPATRVLHGLAASAGVATGPARVMLSPQEGQPLRPGEILIARFTDPGWTPYFFAAAGIVMDVGGMLSHGSIVAREYGIPAVVNVGSATRIIRTGQIVRVDGDHGVVTVL